MKVSSPKTRYHKEEYPFDQIMMGMVLDFNPSTGLYTVKLDKGGCLYNVPMLGMYGAQHGTDLSTAGNMRGAVVAIIRLYNKAYILGSLPTQITSNIKVTPDTETLGYGGSDKFTYAKKKDYDVTALRSTDYISGDKIESVEGGSELRLGKEGVATFRVSDLCQITLNKLKDLGRVITRTFQHFSDFGEVQHTHTSNGRVGMSIKGGAVFTSETHPSQAKWTVQVYLGDNPGGSENDRLHVRVNDVANSNFVTLTFTADGKVFLNTSSDQSITVGGNVTETVSGSKSENVSGSKSIQCGGFTIQCSSLNITQG